MRTRKHERPTPRRARGDDGAALVEFALISVLLFTLIFGIISFGLLLSFKQDLTRAAAEGARAGAVARPGTAVAEANAATQEAAEGFGKTCEPGGGLTCIVSPTTFDCDGAGPGDAECVEVTLEYDNEADPIVPPIPLISLFMPDKLEATSVARVNQ